jgi:hypothetical protein
MKNTSVEAQQHFFLHFKHQQQEEQEEQKQNKKAVTQLICLFCPNSILFQRQMENDSDTKDESETGPKKALFSLYFCPVGFNHLTIISSADGRRRKMWKRRSLVPCIHFHCIPFFPPDLTVPFVATDVHEFEHTKLLALVPKQCLTEVTGRTSLPLLP